MGAGEVETIMYNYVDEKHEHPYIQDYKYKTCTNFNYSYKDAYKKKSISEKTS